MRSDLICSIQIVAVTATAITTTIALNMLYLALMLAFFNVMYISPSELFLKGALFVLSLIGRLSLQLRKKPEMAVLQPKGRWVEHGKGTTYIFVRRERPTGGHMMKNKQCQWICKACGCAFEAEEQKPAEAKMKEGMGAKEKSDAELAPCCPECKSYDVQSA